MKRDTYWALGILLAILIFAIARHVINPNSLLLIAAIVPSVILHEVSHGVVANLFGDDTAKRAGRLSLNPLVHIDIFGTLILPAVMILIGVSPIGYAKPVPVNVGKLRSPRNQSVWVSLVGPAVNVVISIVAGVVLRQTIHSALVATPLISQNSLGSGLWIQYLFYLGSINLVLAVFNLIPIPPLDGSVVIERLLPQRFWPGYLRLRRVALPVVIFVFLLFPSVFARVLSPVIDLWVRIFIPGL